jgi:structural maintenance of chromosome 4
MKPKGQNENEDGLLEYLEDIIGTNKYKTLIEEALKEFEEANTVFEQEIQKFKIVQKDAMNLEDKSQTAMKYIEWENEKTLLNNRILQLKLKTAEVTIEASRDQIVFRIN